MERDRLQVGGHVDERNLAETLEQYYGPMRRAALVVCGNPWDADDLVQETFVEAFASLNRFERRSRLSTWLYGILLNVHRRQQRSRRRYWKRCIRWLMRQERPAEPGPEEVAMAREWQASVWSHVGQLPAPQRDVLVLRYSEGLSYQEIAEAVGCPLGTVKSRIHQGLAALQRTLAAPGPGGQARLTTPEARLAAAVPAAGTARGSGD